MKENKYDNESFFEQYSRFPRSAEGLSAAGEWHALKKMLPPFEGKRVLDIGCGFGWHCVYAADNGASYVLGTDISEKMLAVAKQKTQSPVVVYQKIAMEDLAVPPESFDVVISSLAFHYTPSFPDLCKRIYDCLVPGGNFVFSVEHPVFTASGTQDWHRNDKGKCKHWPVDRYFSEGERDTVFLGEHVIKYHRTVTAYINTVIGCGFLLTGLVEPQPDSRLLDEVPGMRDELRRPMMLLISAQKPTDAKK